MKTPLLTATGILLLVSIFTKAQCVASGPRSAGTSASISFSGSNFNFSNVNNIFSSDNNRASATGLLTLFNGETEYLQATDFGFNIPTSAIICGIVVETEKSATGIGTVLGIGLSFVTDYSVRLVHNGVVSGNNKASAAQWTGTESYHSYGGPNDIWGIAWSPADINSSNFGIAFSASIRGLAMLIPDVRIDHIRVTVYYNTTILPEHFLSFDAIAENNKAVIEWNTPTGISAPAYTVQRSRDGLQWETVHGEISKSYQAGKIIYSMDDMHPYHGESYYRVRATKLSGETTYSTTRAIHIANTSQLKIFPNPFTDHLTISGLERGEKMILTDLCGRKISTDLNKLSPGIYLLHINNQTFKIQKL